LFVGEWVDD
jgi:hypothetical protein